MKRAVFIKEWPPKGDLEAIFWRLYRCEPGGPLPEFVIVSASDVARVLNKAAGWWRHPRLVPETRIYAASPEGEVASFSIWLWEERDTLDHEHVLRKAGYEPEGYPGWNQPNASQ